MKGGGGGGLIEPLFFNKKLLSLIRVNKLFNVPNGVNKLKTKVHNLDITKLKTVPVDVKKLNDVVEDEVVKNTKFKTLKTN